MTAPPPDTPNRIYRQRSPQVSGWACLVICALLLIMSAVSWASSHPSWVFVAWVCFGAAVAWAVLLRPSLELSQRGVLLRNVLRDVHIPWTQVDDVGQRWNVKVYTPDDRSYPSWAIAAQADRPRRSVLGQRLRDYDASLNPGDPGTDTPQQKVTASLVAEEIRRGRAEYDVGRERGLVGPVGEGHVDKQWAWAAIAPVLLTAVAVAVLSLT